MSLITYLKAQFFEGHSNLEAPWLANCINGKGYSMGNKNFKPFCQHHPNVFNLPSLTCINPSKTIFTSCPPQPLPILFCRFWGQGGVWGWNLVLSRKINWHGSCWPWHFAFPSAWHMRGNPPQPPHVGWLGGPPAVGRRGRPSVQPRTAGEPGKRDRLCSLPPLAW